MRRWPTFSYPGQGFVEEVEQIIVQRHDTFHELDVTHQPREVIREELDGRHRTNAAGVKR